MANPPKRRKKRKSGAGNQMSGVRIFYRQCLKIRSDLERVAVAAYQVGWSTKKLRMEELEMLVALKDVPSFFAIAENESAGWYKRPVWADARYGAR